MPLKGVIKLSLVYVKISMKSNAKHLKLFLKYVYTKTLGPIYPSNLQLLRKIRLHAGRLTDNYSLLECFEINKHRKISLKM